MNKDIVFFGIQGSWKWTQAKIFLEEYPNFKYIEPGQIFRALSSNANAISGFMKDTMAQWKMLPDTLAFDLFTMCFHLLESNEYISREKAVERILNRAKEQNRADDLDMNTINKRLDTFEKETLPVIKYFESIWKLITVWAGDSVDEIYKKMIDSLKVC